MKKSWNSLLQKWIYELDPADITYTPDSPTPTKHLIMVVSAPELEMPHRIDVQWN
jgi:hypothetical protein